MGRAAEAKKRAESLRSLVLKPPLLSPVVSADRFSCGGIKEQFVSFARALAGKVEHLGNGACQRVKRTLANVLPAHCKSGNVTDARTVRGECLRKVTIELKAA